jgi:hypothetical protein|tara:strand:+ start:240 stop:503 length:264 start_codon:yes stop_codon:yes gene_type:complete
MPTKTKEYSLYDPGCLVVCKTDIYSSVAIDGDGGGTNRVQAGTVGLIISGPQPAKGYREHFYVQFLKDIKWWVRADEIEPYINYFYP